MFLPQAFNNLKNIIYRNCLAIDHRTSPNSRSNAVERITPQNPAPPTPAQQDIQLADWCSGYHVSFTAYVMH